MKKRLRLLLQLLVTIGIFILIFNKYGFSIQSILSKINFIFILIACCVRVFISPLIYINRWKLFLKYSGINESFFTLLKITFIAEFFGVALPSSQGADGVRMIMIENKHKGEKLGATASSSVIIERMLGFFILALMGLVFCLLSDFPNKNRILILIGGINVALWGVIVVLVNKHCYQVVKRLLSRIRIMKKVVLFIDKTFYSISIFPYKSVLLSSTFLILLFQLCTVVIVYLVFLSFGINLPFKYHLSFYPIIGILSVIPITISGLGLREGFFVYFYSLVGVPADVAVSVSLINFLVEAILVAILGGFIYFFQSVLFVRREDGNIFLNRKSENIQ